MKSYNEHIILKQYPLFADDTNIAINICGLNALRSVCNCIYVCNRFPKYVSVQKYSADAAVSSTPNISDYDIIRYGKNGLRFILYSTGITWSYY